MTHLLDGCSVKDACEAVSVRAAARGVAALLMLLVAVPPALGAPPVDFTRDIRPILSNHCFKCHGPDEATREANLRLDTAEGSYADLGGSRAVDPDNPLASALLERITTTDADLQMPPPDSGLQLTPDQIARLKAWVAAGGKYQQHWAFRPIERSPAPRLSPTQVPSTSDSGKAGASGETNGAGSRPSDPGSAAAADREFVRGPLDAFILSKLQAARLAPSPAADRQTLIRRVHLDLLGLPPDPEAIQRFVADASPEAYERMVDRVLASPHFGEKWGRHWLDQARYADTNGYTIDSERSIWPYRDWVIQAFNQDLPFDQFTVEQLAGDLLNEPTQSQLVATGFHRNTLVNQEGGTDREQFRNEAVVDRVNTTGAVWLGLTVGCAQCHTHKYDPLSQHEYYRLFAFFNSSQDVNSVTPTLSVTTAERQRQLAELDQQIATARQALETFDRQRNERLPPSERSDGQPVAWRTVNVEQVESAAGAEFQTLDDGSLLAGGPNGDSDTYTLRFRSPLPAITAVRLEVLTHPSLPRGGPGRAANGNFVLNDLQLVAGKAAAQWLHATADHSQKDYDVTKAIDADPASGWAIGGANPANANRTATFVTAKLAVTEPPGDTEPPAVTLRLEFGSQPPGYNIGRFRISVTDAPHAKLDVPDPERAKLAEAVKRATDQRAQFARSIPTTMIMRDLDKPRETHVLIRGDFLRRGDPVVPDAPAFLPPMPDSDQVRTRLDLARWLVDGRNPLTARVRVNRIWMRLFGQGLVETENDFGLQGTPPTHPELLDWLSAELMRHDWSTKHLIRLIVLSSTYRQSSAIREDLQQADPLNKLLARQSRVRVDAEIVRDMALAASGLLNRTIGGKSVYPPQPSGVYAFTQRSAAWPTSSGADRYRRGMYTFFMRSAPHPLLTTFDSPAFNTTCTRRVRSNTPLQALTMANDQALVETARGLAQRLLQESPPNELPSGEQPGREQPGDEQSGAEREADAWRLERAFLLCLSRRPEPVERERLLEFLAEQQREFAAAPDDAKQLVGGPSAEPSELARRAAWTVVARVLLNLDEFITRE